jgi:hypothetical protein
MNSNEEKIISKASFYKSNELKAHVLIIPRGRYKNGRFVSELIDGKYFWFIENNTSIAIRLFLTEIYDVMDFIEKEEG